MEDEVTALREQLLEIDAICEEHDAPTEDSDGRALTIPERVRALLERGPAEPVSPEPPDREQ